MIENKIAADARIEHTAATPAIHVDKYTKIRGVSIRSASFLCSKGARNYLPQTSPLHFMYQILAAISGTSGQKA